MFRTLQSLDEVHRRVVVNTAASERFKQLKKNYSKQDFAQNKHCVALHVSSGQTEIIGVIWERRGKTVRAISATRSGVRIITWSPTAARRGAHGRLR